MSDEVNARLSPTYDCKKIFIAKRYNCRKTTIVCAMKLCSATLTKNKKNKCEKFLYLRYKSLE